MYAIIKTGGKQYRVSEGQTLRVEKLIGEPGAAVSLDEVLLVAREGQATIGTPLVSGASVKATITGQAKAKKVLIFKKKRRKGYHKKQGHRQLYTELKITGISA
jgi:large subunit ribosomal protein L21